MNTDPEHLYQSASALAQTVALEAVATLHDRALHHCETCELSAAAPLALQALALLEPLGKTALGTVTTVMLNLAGILEDHGHYCAAVRLCQLAVESANATPVRVVCLTQLLNLSRLKGSTPRQKYSIARL
ncbi:MAG: hypothetical protein R2932_49970 [Caldilineaceae bacterium]